MTSSRLLQELRALDRSSPEFHDRLSSILYGEAYKKYVPRLRGDDLMSLVDCLDKALDTLDPASPAFRKSLRELRHICGTMTILPTPYILSPSRLIIGEQPVASGGSGDIYQGTLDGEDVCVKRVRVYSKDGPERATKTLYQEAVVWRRLTHPNIVPLLGITPKPLQLISEWMPGGDLTEYIKRNPDASRLGLLSDVANGLYYLHSSNIIHGDLKGPNILVDASGRAQITDFGLATVTLNLDSIRTASDDHGHTARWTAPEILSEVGTYSKEADIFAFAMVMIEVFTGAVPFHNSLPAAAVLAIMNGTRPPRPAHARFTDQLWGLMQRCWDQNPNSRPEVSEVLKVLCGSDPLPLKLTIYNPPSNPALKTDQQHPPPERTSEVHHSPSLRESVSSSRPTLQTTPQKSNYSSGTSPLNSWGGNAGLEGGGNARPYDRPQTMSRGPSLEQQGGQPIGRRASRRNTAQSEPSPLPDDPQPFDRNGLRRDQVYHQGHGHTGGAGTTSLPSLPNTLSRSASKRKDGSGNSRSDANRDLDDGGGGVHPSVVRQGDRGAPSGQDTPLPKNPTQDHLGQHNQSSTSASPAPLELSSRGSEATGINPHESSGTDSRLELLSMGDGTPSAETSWKNTSSVHTGYTSRNTFRRELRTGHGTRDQQEPPAAYDQSHTPSVIPSIESEAHSNTLSEGALLGTPSPSRTGRGLPACGGQMVPEACVDAPADPPIFTSGGPRATLRTPGNSRTASPSYLRRFKNACRTFSAAVVSAVRGIFRRDARAPAQRAGHTRDISVRERTPLFRALQSCCCFCCCQRPCF